MSAICRMGNLFLRAMRYFLVVVDAFTGNFAQMFESMQRFNQLPDETVVCLPTNITRVILSFAETILGIKVRSKSTCFVERYRAEGNRVCQQQLD